VRRIGNDSEKWGGAMSGVLVTGEGGIGFSNGGKGNFRKKKKTK